ncbi:MAG TPA: asparagine synthase-related protein [Gemmatimonadales bacterium]|nr:asparagine synthase-related protein [Gemmatimonadales bacterium]
MGAIYGLVGWADLQAAEAVGRRLAHRGRDGAAWSPGHGVVLGARGSRLLVDLQEHGPVAFDGAIDNRREVAQWLGRRDAAALGPADDAHLLFEVVSTHGVEGLARLGGVFAAALWLGSERRLLLVRDRLGYAPLSFALLGERCVFASETKALLALDELPIRLNRGALQTTLTRGRPPPGISCFDGIYPVPPGSCIELRPGRTSGRRFWEFPPGPTNAIESDRLARLRASFLDAVRRETSAYARVGIGLSGGFHSAIIAAGVRTVAGGREVHTYTAGYGAEDLRLSEAERVALALGTRHHPLIVSPADLPALLPWVAWLLEEPAGAEDLPLLFLAAREASSTVDLFLTGSGCAELFGETGRHRLARLALRYPMLRGPVAELYAHAAGVRPGSRFGRMAQAFLRYRSPAHPRVRGTASGDGLPNLPPTGPGAFGALLRAEFLASPPSPPAEHLVAAAGARLNAAITDPTFFVAALELADGARARGGPITAGLRRSCARLMPALERQTSARGQSVHHSAELCAVLDGMAAEMLTPERVRARGLFDPAEVQAVVAGRPRRGQRPERAARLWSLLLVEAWCQAYLDRRGAAPAGRVPSARRQDSSAPRDPAARRHRPDASTLRGDLPPPAGA